MDYIILGSEKWTRVTIWYVSHYNLVNFRHI